MGLLYIVYVCVRNLLIAVLQIFVLFRYTPHANTFKCFCCCTLFVLWLPLQFSPLIRIFLIYINCAYFTKCALYMHCGVSDGVFSCHCTCSCVYICIWLSTIDVCASFPQHRQPSIRHDQHNSIQKRLVGADTRWVHLKTRNSSIEK